MGACTKYATSFILSVLLNYVSVNGDAEITSNNVNVLQAVRAKRQTGYVYDRPSISFDLPTRTPIVSTSTQASPVDRISMRMYYAYPVPAEPSIINIGFNNPGTAAPSTTESAVNTGYNYNLPNAQSSSTGNFAGSGGNTGGGYNIAVQNTEVQDMQSGSVANGGNSGGGYNYGVQNTAVEYSQSVPTGDVGTVNSGASGYSYGIQNTVQINPGQNTVTSSTQSVSDNNIGAGGSGSSTGYNYGVQNNAVSNAGSGIVINTAGSGPIQTSTQVSNTGVSGVSTNAPQYLPPSNTVAVTNAPINVQTGSTITVSAPSDTYLPPSVAVKSTPAVQTVSNAPAVNVVTQTSNTPNPGYLVPNTVAATTNAPVIQTQTIAPVRQPQQITTLPAQTYLPPIVTQRPVSTPAPSYLPPVF